MKAGSAISKNEALYGRYELQARSFGITRVGDITDLDIIGLPVWFAVRPNSRTLSVSQGKGLTHEQARISAIMEAIESAVAEQTAELVSVFGNVGELAALGHRSVPLHKLDRCRYSAFCPKRERAWVQGWDVLQECPVYAPYELVGLDLRPQFPWDHNCFHIGSVGLAAGPTFEFASVAALLELVERDATALHELFGIESSISRRVAWEPGLHSGLDIAIGKLTKAGLVVHLFVTRSSVGLPTFSALISRPVIGKKGSGIRYSSGFSCRLDPGDAALAAILEAVQSRLTNIAGSRDDLTDDQYELFFTNESDRHFSGLRIADVFEDFSPICGKHTNNYDAILSSISAAGFREIFLFDLPTGVAGIRVVRALVPGLRSGVSDLNHANLAELRSLASQSIF